MVVYKFVEYNDRTDKMKALIDKELHKDGEWKIAFVTSRNINTLVIFEQISDSNPKPNLIREVTVTSEKPIKKAPITVAE